MIAIPGSQGGHVPDGLVYGPVTSQRFGQSLGVSFSHSGAVSCRWRCPYCQLGGGGPADVARLQADPEAILSDLRNVLAESTAGIEVVTIAGAGEPLDHPQAEMLLAECRTLCQEYQLPLVLLTNGDALVDRQLARQVATMDQCFVKWDPGAVAGCWRAITPLAQEQRCQALAALPQLRLQSLLFAVNNQSSGTSRPRLRERYIADLQRLQPVELHLTTAYRDQPEGLVQPVAKSELQEWAAMVADQVPGCQVRVF